MANNFNVPAGEMLEKARTMNFIFNDDKALFEAFDADFADPFSANWLAKIDEAEGMETAENRLDRQMQETEEVLAAMRQATQVYSTARYFIEKAYPNANNVQNTFGLNDFSTFGNTQQNMVLFLKNLYNKCSSPTYKPALLAAGMTEPQIEAIKEAKDLFIGENTEQNAFIEYTAQDSDNRSNVYNQAYAFMQKVNRASKVVFYGNVIKLNQYLLPHGSEGQDYVVEGKVLDGSNNNVALKGCTVEILGNGLSTTTNSYGNFGFVALTPGNYTARISRAGYTTVDAPFSLTANSKATLNIVLQLAP